MVADNVSKQLSDISDDIVAYGDDDNDIPHSSKPIAGTIQATWSYIVPDAIDTPLSAADLKSKFDACKAPYTLKISTTAVAQSQFGSPINNDYNTLTKSYTIRVDDYKKCYIKPAGDSAYTGECKTAGNCKYSEDYNPDVFVVGGGYLPTANPTFPTTGFNKAKFTLIMSNRQNDYNYESSDFRVVIDSAGEVIFNFPTRPVLPLTVTLKATPKSSIAPSASPREYTFTIQKWAIANNTVAYNTASDYSGTYDAAISCGATPGLSGAADRVTADSYLFSRKDLTNAPNATAAIAGWASNSDERFSRDIDGTLTGEWGNLYTKYPGSGFDEERTVWSNEELAPGNYFTIDTGNGSVATGTVNATAILPVCSK